VIRGEPKPFLRHRLRTASEKLHDQYSLELKKAMVDEVSLMSYDSVLRGTLLQEPHEKRERQKGLGRAATAVMAVAFVIFVVMGLGTFLRAQARDARFDRFISHVKSSESVLITDYGKNKDGKYFVTGLIPGTASAGALPVEEFGFSRDEVSVKLMKAVFAVDQARSEEELNNFQVQLHDLDGTPWPTGRSPSTGAWLETTTDRIANAYLLGRALGRTFIVVIEHPRNLKAPADKLSGQIAWRLHLQGIYDPHLLRTLAVDREPGVLRVLQEKTAGDERDKNETR
jgi:hypothetical protein